MNLNTHVTLNCNELTINKSTVSSLIKITSLNQLLNCLSFVVNGAFS